MAITHTHTSTRTQRATAINNNKKNTEYNRINKLTKLLSNFVPAERNQFWIFKIDKTRICVYKMSTKAN